MFCLIILKVTLLHFKRTINLILRVGIEKMILGNELNDVQRIVSGATSHCNVFLEITASHHHYAFRSCRNAKITIMMTDSDPL